MTGYGRACLSVDGVRFVAEVSAVNRRFLELSFSLPRGFERFELDLRKLANAHVNRGAVSIRVRAEFLDASPFVFEPDMTLAQGLWQGYENLASKFGLALDKSEIFARLLENPDILQKSSVDTEIEGHKSSLSSVLSDALFELNKARVMEGSALQSELLTLLSSLESALTVVEGRADLAVQRYREKLSTRLEEFLPGAVENEERVLREIVVYADRVDVSEELARLKHHLQQFRAQLESDDYVSGKRCEFWVQELLRETNTIGSKSSDLLVSETVVKMKSDIERIREPSTECGVGCLVRYLETWLKDYYLL